MADRNEWLAAGQWGDPGPNESRAAWRLAAVASRLVGESVAWVAATHVALGNACVAVVAGDG